MQKESQHRLRETKENKEWPSQRASLARMIATTGGLGLPGFLLIPFLPDGNNHSADENEKDSSCWRDQDNAKRKGVEAGHHAEHTDQTEGYFPFALGTVAEEKEEAKDGEEKVQ